MHNTLEEFDFAFQTSTRCDSVLDGQPDFPDGEKEGRATRPAGTGKTPLSIALGIGVCLAEQRVPC